jgi:hypothetical protein
MSGRPVMAVAVSAIRCGVAALSQAMPPLGLRCHFVHSATDSIPVNVPAVAEKNRTLIVHVAFAGIFWP